MMFQTDDTLVIPLWIAGHAFLTMVQDFQDVCNPVTGEVLRRTPLCGAREAVKAIEAARAVMPRWRALPDHERAALLVAVGHALSGYADHFSRLIVEETGKQRNEAEGEVTAAVALLGTPGSCGVSGVVFIAGGSETSFMEPLLIAVPALASGATVIVRPHPKAPSALFALAELTARCGFPGGVFNIVHGNDGVVDAMRALAADDLPVLVIAD